MNPFHNPVFLLRVLKSYLLDQNRLARWNETKLRMFQDKQLRGAMTRALQTDLYAEKYQAAGVDKASINGIGDLPKLPVVGKDDFARYPPEGIVPDHDPSSLVEVATSGTTGKSLALYVDFTDIVGGLFGYLRMLQHYGIKWRTHRISIVGDFAAHTAESGYINRGVSPRFSNSFLFKNVQWLNTNDDPKQVLENLERFRPDCIWAYVGMLGHLAVLKGQGLGQQVTPRVIAATGSVLDPSLRQAIETAFHSKVYEVYGATETGPIAYQCTQGGYHVLSDLLHLEVMKDGQPVPVGKAGRLVVTKLYGGGTPIIRYDAVNDIVSLRPEPCSCGEVGQLIGRIYGRDDLSLILPGGHALLPASLSEIYSKLLHELRTTRVKNTKIIQHDLTHIDVLVELSESGIPSDDDICAFMQQQFQRKVGSGIEVSVRPVPSIERGSPRIVSHVDRGTVGIVDYI